MSKEVSEEEEKGSNIRTWLICKINTTYKMYFIILG